MSAVEAPRIMPGYCRIDYQVTTRGLAELARSASIYKAERFSDHAPLTVDY